MVCRRMIPCVCGGGEVLGDLHPAGAPGREERVVGHLRDVLCPDPTKYKTKYPFPTVLGFARASRSRCLGNKVGTGEAPGLLPLYHPQPGPGWLLLPPAGVGLLSSRQSEAAGVQLSIPSVPGDYVGKEWTKRPPLRVSCTVPSHLGL